MNNFSSQNSNTATHFLINLCLRENFIHNNMHLHLSIRFYHTCKNLILSQLHMPARSKLKHQDIPCVIEFYPDSNSRLNTKAEKLHMLHFMPASTSSDNEIWNVTAWNTIPYFKYFSSINKKKVLMKKKNELLTSVLH